MPESQFDRYEDHIIVSTWRKFAYALGHFGATISSDMVNVFVMTYYPVILKLNPMAVGAALVWPRLWDAVSDALMGHVSDRTKSRWGRRRPYLLFGAPLLALTTWLMFAPPSWLSEHGMIIYIMIISFVYYTSYTIIIVPYTALGAELSVDYHERTRVQIWRSVLLYCVQFIVPCTWWLTQRSIFPNERVGAMWVTGAYGILIIIPLWICFAGTREDAELQTRKGVPFLQAFKITFTNKTFVVFCAAYAILLVALWAGFGMANYVSIYHTFGGSDRLGAGRMQMITGLVSGVTMILGSIGWGWLGTRMGKKPAFIACLASAGLMAPLAWFLFTPAYPYLQLIFSAVVGLAFGGLQVFPFAMIADICDADELTSGARREGAYNGITAFVIKLGFSANFLITGTLLKLCGFEESIEVQSLEAVTQMRVLLCVIPLIGMLLTVAVLWFYPLSERRVREIRTILEDRRAQAVAIEEGKA